MKGYKALNKNEFTNGNFSIVPIRYEDRFAIMKWRNEQLYHLRQSKPLTVEDQEHYFNGIVDKLFNQEQPNQILFSFLENGLCIGYGGLVHINWIDKNAEISFIMDTQFEAIRFHEIWTEYLLFLEKVAFKDLKLHKIFTYAFDLRPHLYVALKEANFMEETRLKEHCLFDGKYIDVLIHSKINKKLLRIRRATLGDTKLYFDWANDSSVREQSYKSSIIDFESHKKWFETKLKDDSCILLVFQNQHDKNVGQIRIQKENEHQALIGISIAVEHRGKGYAKDMLLLASDYFSEINKGYLISAYIKEQNSSSKHAFEKAGFEFQNIINYENCSSFHFIKKV
jgi:RimJ/RimL family protein N-acetyltransferase